MTNFTLNNHLQYEIGGRLWGHREFSEEKYVVKVGQVDPEQWACSNWYAEQLRTAGIIRNEFGRDLVVMFSGGTDSEIVLKSFLKIGFKPRACFIRFKNDYNAADAAIADTIARSLGIELTMLDFDVVDFYKSGAAAELATKIQCRQIAYLSVYHHIGLLGSPAVMGGEVMFRRHVTPSGSEWYYCFRENEDGSAMRWSADTGIPLVNEWFSYTPEMIGYYLKHPGIQDLIKNRYNYKLASVSSKNKILRELFPGLVPKVKTHGYEQLLGFNGETYRKLHLSYPKRFSSGIDGIFIKDLEKQLFGEQYVSD